MTQTRPSGGQVGHTCCHHAAAARAVCADRERELMELKGPCSTRTCRLHRAHSGPCDVRPVPANPPTLRDIQAATHAERPLTLTHVAVAGAVPAPADPKG